MCQISARQAATLWPGLAAQQAAALAAGPVVALQLLGEGLRCCTLCVFESVIHTTPCCHRGADCPPPPTLCCSSAASAHSGSRLRPFVARVKGAWLAADAIARGRQLERELQNGQGWCLSADRAGSVALQLDFFFGDKAQVGNGTHWLDGQVSDSFTGLLEPRLSACCSACFHSSRQTLQRQHICERPAKLQLSLVWQKQGFCSLSTTLLCMRHLLCDPTDTF